MPRDGLEVTVGRTEHAAMVCHRLRLLVVIKVPRNFEFLKVSLVFIIAPSSFCLVTEQPLECKNC